MARRSILNDSDEEIVWAAVDEIEKLRAKVLELESLVRDRHQHSVEDFKKQVYCAVLTGLCQNLGTNENMLVQRTESIVAKILLRLKIQ